MRIRKLELRAFGPFTSTVLDFGDAGAGLHVIHGENEAGKSTALRAIGDFLYGIPETTRDDHVHPKPKLRIAAEIAGEDGHARELVRRKARKRPLRDAADAEPVDETELQHALGGVSRTLFERLFGLDRTRLQEGAHALLREGGHAGQSLFDAGAGGRSVHELLEALETEASQLFTPRAQTRTLNQAIKDYDQAKRAARDDALSADAWRQQQQEIDTWRAERDRLKQRERAIKAEQHRLAQLLEARASARDHTQAVARLEGEIERLAERREHLAAPESLADVSEAAIADVRDRLGTYRKARAERPELEARLRALEDDAQGILRRLGHDPSLERAWDLRPSQTLQSRIRALASQRSGLESELRNARQGLEQATQRLQEIDDALAALPPAQDVETLGHAVDRAARLGDAPAWIAEAERNASYQRERAEKRRAALGLWDGPLSEAVSLPVPDTETVDRFAKEWDALADERTVLERRREEIDNRTREVDRDLDALRRAGEVPTEQQLADARRRRDELWHELRDGRRELHGTDGTEFEDALRQADDVADRLWREATRVAEHAHLQAERRDLDERRRAAEREQETLDARSEKLTHQWEAQWAPAGIEPRAPPEMRGWLRRLDEVIELADEHDRAARELASRQARVAELRDELDRELRAREEPGARDDERFEALRDRARDVVERTRRHADEHERLDEERARLAREARRLQGEVNAHEDKLATWHEQWRQCARALGLHDDAMPEEANDVLEQLHTLFAHLDEANDLRRRLQTMDDDRAQLEDTVSRLVQEHLPEAAEMPLEDQAEHLQARYRDACEQRRIRRDTERELADKREQLEQQTMGLRNARAKIEELTGAPSHETGEGAGGASERAEPAGSSPDDLDLARADDHELRARLEEIDRDLEEVADAYSHASHQLGAQETGLERLRERNAASSAAEAETRLATVREHAHQYVRLRLAATLLRLELERYREQNQDPIVQRAGEVLARLTVGSFHDLRTTLDDRDEPVLRCVRSDGTEVGVDGLSTGTRDQLFLALRIASLERHAAYDSPLPVVLDDVLEGFDERRTRAGFEALGELAHTMQVLFFTHHSRVVEIAREAVPPERIRVHDLDAVRGTRRDDTRDTAAEAREAGSSAAT